MKPDPTACIVKNAGVKTLILALFFCLSLPGFALSGEQAAPPKRRPPPDRPQQNTPRKPNPWRGKVRPITDEVFERAVRRGISSVYFWAEWCGPCRTQGPIMDDLAKKYAGKVKMYKMDIDAELETRGKYDIRQVPSTIIFFNGKPIVKLIGLIDEEEFAEEVEELLKQPPQPAPSARGPGQAPGGKRPQPPAGNGTPMTTDDFE